MTRGPKPTFDTDHLRRLVAKGKSAAEIAEAMGVSRQRIHQVATRAGIKIPKVWRPRGPATPRRAVPRVQTGGPSVPINTSVAGRVAEMLVAADLMARGWKVFFPLTDRGRHDIVASRGGLLRSFEVRSGRRIVSKVSFARDLAGAPSDHYAVVVTGEPVIYDPPLDPT